MNYSPQQLNFIKRHCRQYNDRELAILFNAMFSENKTPEKIKACRKNHGFKRGVSGCFPKGLVPWNKGLKLPGTGSTTSFRKGIRPHNTDPVGAEVARDDGYLWVKIAEPNQWRQRHVLVWEEQHGQSVPAGHAVKFLDGDRRNFALENLLLVTRRQLCVFNKRQYSMADAAVQPVLNTIVALDLARMDAEKRRVQP